MLLYRTIRRRYIQAGSSTYRVLCVNSAGTSHGHCKTDHILHSDPCCKRHHRFLNNTGSKTRFMTLNNVTYSKLRFYSDFKDDDIVKSWIKEIKQDFEKPGKEKTELNEENYFKDIENETNDTDKVDGLMNSERLSQEQKQSLLKLSNIANEIVGLEAKNEEGSSSDSDLLSSESDSDSDSDSSDDEKDKSLHAEGFTDKEMVRLLKDSELSEHDSSDEPGAIEGFTKEEMIQMLKDTHALGTDISDEEEDMESHENNVDHIEDDTDGGKTKASLSDLGVAATRMKEDKLKEDWAVVEIEDFVNIEPEPDVEAPWVPPISLEKGKAGIFDIEDMVTLLQSANTFDLVVMKLPADVQLADYMIIASVKSMRHLKALSSDIQFIYKKRAKKRSAHLRVEGEGSQWHAMDIGNIFLHLFLPQAREVYDLETLWTVGPRFDENLRAQEVDPYVFSVDELPWLRELEEGKKDSESKHVKEQDEIVIEKEKL